MIPLPGNFSGLFFVHLPTLNFFSQKYTLSQKILHIKCKYKKEYRNSKKEIKMRKKILLLTLTLSAVMLAAGCGKPKTVKEDIVAESEEKDTVDITTDPTNSPTPTIKTEDDFTEEDFKNAEYVAIDNVNVRANPDANSDIISSMEKGSRVKVSGREEDKEGNKWYKVSADDSGTIGYMSTKYVNIVHKKGDTAK
jgi:uncharacterized protein YgiM (DUF1202 family)